MPHEQWQPPPSPSPYPALMPQQRTIYTTNCVIISLNNNEKQKKNSSEYRKQTSPLIRSIVYLWRNPAKACAKKFYWIWYIINQSMISTETPPWKRRKSWKSCKSFICTWRFSLMKFRANNTSRIAWPAEC